MPVYRLANHDWNGDGTSGEAGGYLMISAGDRIEVLVEGTVNSWWQGKLGEKTGWFPSAFTSPEVPDGNRDGAGGAASRVAGGGISKPPLPRALSMQLLDTALKQNALHC